MARKRIGFWEKLVVYGLPFLLMMNIAIHPDRYQWDLRVYRQAAKVFEEGGNPYDAEKVMDATGVAWPFVYPPLSLHLFRPFAAISPGPAQQLWFCLKLAALAALFGVWGRRFLPLTADGPTVLFFVLAFNSTILLDMRSGNPAMLEELALWYGFSRLLAGRPWPLCLAIVALSQVKVMPVCLAVLFLLVVEKPLWAPFAAAIGGTVALWALNPLLYPEMTRAYLGLATGISERGFLNPSSLALSQDLVSLAQRNGLPLPPLAGPALYALFVAFVAAVSLRALLAARARGVAGTVRLLFVCCCYGLCMPRFKDYTYVLLLVPALYALRNLAADMRLGLPLVFILLPQISDQLPLGVPALSQLAQEYAPWIGNLLVWTLYLRELGRTPTLEFKEPNASFRSS